MRVQVLQHLRVQHLGALLEAFKNLERPPKASFSRDFHGFSMDFNGFSIDLAAEAR